MLFRLLEGDNGGRLGLDGRLTTFNPICEENARKKVGVEWKEKRSGTTTRRSVSFKPHLPAVWRRFDSPGLLETPFLFRIAFAQVIVVPSPESDGDSQT